MLLISVGVSGLEGGDCPLCSISGRSHPGSAEVVTTFSAQDVVIRWPEGVQAPVGCLFSRPSARVSQPAGSGACRAGRACLPHSSSGCGCSCSVGEGRAGRGGRASCSLRRGGWGESQGPRERGQDLSSHLESLSQNRQRQGPPSHNLKSLGS